MKQKCGQNTWKYGERIDIKVCWTFGRPSQYASDLYQISLPRTPHISRDMSVPNSARDWDILVFLSPCLLRHAPTFKRSGHPAEPISGERFGRHGDIRFWTHDKCQNQIFSIFYISSSTRSLWGVLQSPFLGGGGLTPKKEANRVTTSSFGVLTGIKSATKHENKVILHSLSLEESHKYNL